MFNKVNKILIITTFNWLSSCLAPYMVFFVSQFNHLVLKLHLTLLACNAFTSTYKALWIASFMPCAVQIHFLSRTLPCILQLLLNASYSASTERQKAHWLHADEKVVWYSGLTLGCFISNLLIPEPGASSEQVVSLRTEGTEPSVFCFETMDGGQWRDDAVARLSGLPSPLSFSSTNEK